MANKPKIYGNCKAGCQWETVHKDDWERSASHTEVTEYTEVDGWRKQYNVELYRKYKIFCTQPTFGGDWVALCEKDGNHRIYFEHLGEAAVEYRNYYIFELLDLTFAAHETDSTAQVVSMVYEVNGTRYTQKETVYSDWSGVDFVLRISTNFDENFDGKVYVYDPDAEVLVRGEDGVDCLVYNAKSYAYSDVPSVGSVMYFSSSNFNRTPIVGDYFNLIISVGEETYLGIYSVYEVTDTQARANVVEVRKLSGNGFIPAPGDDFDTDAGSVVYINRSASSVISTPKAGDILVDGCGYLFYVTEVTETKIIGKALGVTIAGKDAPTMYNHRIGLYLGFSSGGSKDYVYFNVQTPDSEPYTASNVSTKLSSYGYSGYIPAFDFNSYASGTHWAVQAVAVYTKYYYIYGMKATYTSSGYTLVFPANTGGGMWALAQLEWGNGGEMTDTVTPLTL